MLMMRKRMVRMVFSRWVQVRFRRDAFRFSDGVELKAATQVVCEHVQLLPGAIGGIAFSGHDVESELAAQFGEGFLLAASPLIACLNHGAVHIYRQTVQTQSLDLARGPIHRSTPIGP